MNKHLKAARAIAADLLEKTSNMELSTYKTHRDDKGNLYIEYADGVLDRLPYIPFRPYQAEVAVKLFVELIRRFLLERPRRSGKEVESWNCIIQGAVEDPGLYMMVYPTNVRARAVLWDGSILMPDGVSVKFLDMIPRRLLMSMNNQEMKIKLVNGSVIWVVGSDIDPDKLRGTNPRGIVYAEFAFQDPRVCYVMMPALRQNGGWMLGQSTFDGMNHFYQMIQNNKDDPLWYCRVDSITNLVDENGNRYITDEMIEEDRRAGMPEYLIQQEYYGVVQVNQETKYFAHAIKNIFDNDKLITGLIIPTANVYAAWDLGINDCCAITLFQVWRKDGQVWPKVIGYIESNNRDLKYYVGLIRQFCNRYNLLLKDHFIPHDGQKRDFNTGKNTIDFLAEMGEKGIIIPRPPSKENAIEAMRQKLYITEFNKENTQRLIDCLCNYSKEFDDKLGTYKNRPVHNWASHGVDSFQTMTLALDGGFLQDLGGYMDVVYIN
jgi:hypothetical protein